MSITEETAKERAKDCAVLCCRAEEGTLIQVSNLEDPAIFDDLIDSGLLELEGALTIEQALGTRLKKTCDALCPLTPELVEGITDSKEAAEGSSDLASVMSNASYTSFSMPGGVLKIHIGEGKDIDIELPVGLAAGAAETESTAKEDAQQLESEEKPGRRPGKEKTVIIKEVAKDDEGYGALLESIFHTDLGSVPVCVSVREVSEFSIEEPVVAEALADQETDLCGMILMGIPESQEERERLMRRINIMTEMMDVERTIVISEERLESKE